MITDSLQLKMEPKFNKLGPDIHPDSVKSCFFLLSYVHKQVPGCTVACCYLLLFLLATANFYIVVSQDAVTVAVELEMHKASACNVL